MTAPHMWRINWLWPDACAAGDCTHDTVCPTLPFPVCAACTDLAWSDHDEHPAVLWPCPHTPLISRPGGHSAKNAHRVGLPTPNNRVERPRW